MDTKQTLSVFGKVVEALPNTMFRIELEDGTLLTATLKGTLRRQYVRIFPGDRVRVETTVYDKERGRIVQKFK